MNHLKLRRSVSDLTLFRAPAPLESISIDILGELITQKRDNKYLLVTTDQYAKLVKSISMKMLGDA